MSATILSSVMASTTQHRRRISTDSRSFPELTEEEAQQLREIIYESVECQVSKDVLKKLVDWAEESTRASFQPVPKRRTATEIESLEDAAELFDLKLQNRRPFPLKLRNEYITGARKLSHHIKSINFLIHSPYSNHNEEPAFLAVVHLLLLDRLHHLADKEAQKPLRLCNNVGMTAQSTSSSHPTIVNGRADWTLEYGKKFETDTVLVVVEAKSATEGLETHVGLPQLLCYMVAAWEKRYSRANRSCFGICSNGIVWMFIWLSHDREVYTTKRFDWFWDAESIIAHIDMVLEDAIASSPVEQEYILE